MFCDCEWLAVDKSPINEYVIMLTYAWNSW